MTDKELEAKLKKIEEDIRQIKAGSNNPFILIGLQEAVVDLEKKQKEIAKALSLISGLLDRLKSSRSTAKTESPQGKKPMSRSNAL